MTLNQRLILLLLLGLAGTSGVATSLCVVSEDMTRCVCDVMVISNPQSLVCFQAFELELRDGKLDEPRFNLASHLTFAFQLAKMNKFIFNNVTISFSFLSAVIPLLPMSQLNEISFISSTLEAVAPLRPPVLRGTSKIKTLLLEDVTVDPSLLQPSFQPFHHWLFDSLRSLGLVRSGLAEIDCSWARRVENLTHLDLSENLVSDLQSISRCPSLSFKSLKSLHLRHSNLTSLESLCTPLSLAPALTHLDVSRNDFSTFHYPHCLQAQPLSMLNLSHSGITEVNSLLSASLEELDLSYNSLEVFDNPLQSLKKLYLSNNRLTRLPSLDSLSHLQQLSVDGNQLTVLIRGAGADLSALEQLDSLHAARNPYQCDCGLKETITFLDDTDSVSVEDHPDFLCATPLAQQGAQIMNLSLEACDKMSSGTQHHSSLLCLTLFVGLFWLY